MDRKSEAVKLSQELGWGKNTVPGQENSATVPLKSNFKKSAKQFLAIQTEHF